jgi:tetratricopeptide repeat protein
MRPKWGVVGAALVLLALVPGRAWAGYTHYWTWRSRPSPEAVRAAVADMKRLAEARRGILEMKAGDDRIELNGLGEDAHEPFVFPNGWDDDQTDNRGFHFCKTFGKPYDEVVTASLLAARDHFPASVLAIDSDGEFDTDWTAGAALYEEVLHRPARDPLSRGGPASAFAAPSLFRSGIITTLILGALFYFLFLRNSRGGGWGSYYLFWLVAPALIAVVTQHPLVLAVVVVGVIARRWLPDPILILSQAGRIRSLGADVAANPANLTARRDLAVIYLARHRPGKALKLLEEARARDQESVELRYLEGLCLLGLGRHEPALEALLDVVAREPKFRYGEASLRAADALYGLGRWQDAEDGYRHYLEINRSSVEATFKLARAQRKAGDAAAAKATFAGARRMYRELPGFHRRRQLGWYLRALAGV